MKPEKKHFQKKERLSVRLFASLILFTVVALALLWFCQTVFLDDLYKLVKIANINKIAEALEDNISSPDLQDLTGQYAIRYDTCISVWSSNLNRLSGKCMNAGCRIHTYGLYGATHFFTKARENNGKYVEQFGGKNSAESSTNNSSSTSSADPFKTQDDEHESIILAKIIHDQNGNEYLVLINAIISPIGAVVRSLQLIFVFVAVIMLIAAVIVSFAFAKYALDPINKINRTATQFAKGDYAVKFDESSYVEIAELAKTLNFAAKELSSVESTRRELIANVSHDLRTPLTLIGGYAEMMKDFPEEDHTETLNTITEEVEHMTHLVDDMTDVSKYNAGVQKLNITDFNLTQLLSDISERLCKLNDRFGIKINFLHDSQIIISADELKITQVIYNFLNNAITHTGENKLVTISQEVINEGHSKFVQVSITDSGKGIAQDRIKLIWDRYIKLDKTYHRAHNGSGLGLNIVKSILELHNMDYGVIPIEEMPNNTGCTFWFKAKITKITK